MAPPQPTCAPFHSRPQSPPATVGQGSIRGGGGGSGTQKFVYQKPSDQIFPFVNFVFPHDGHFGRGGGPAGGGGGGAETPPPLMVQASTTRCRPVPATKTLSRPGHPLPRRGPLVRTAPASMQAPCLEGPAREGPLHGRAQTRWNGRAARDVLWRAQPRRGRPAKCRSMSTPLGFDKAPLTLKMDDWPGSLNWNPMCRPMPGERCPSPEASARADGLPTCQRAIHQTGRDHYPPLR